MFSSLFTCVPCSKPGGTAPAGLDWLDDPPSAAEQRVLRRLDALRKNRARPDKPVRAHGQRLSSGQRGLSLLALRGIARFYHAHGLLEEPMTVLCKGGSGKDDTIDARDHGGVCVCEVTRSTGLSLAESLALAMEAEDAEGVEIAELSSLPTHTPSELIGQATTFFSYAWTSTTLVDLLTAIGDIDETLRATEEGAAGVPRFLWIDMFCASQNLLADAFDRGRFEKGSADYLARKEQTDRIFDDALGAVDELFFYCAPLVGSWRAPPHPFLDPERGDGLTGPEWRSGPVAISRAWCLFELTTALLASKRVHVVTSYDERSKVDGLLINDFASVASVVSDVNAADAQVSKAEDRSYILGRVRQFEGGIEMVNAKVAGAVQTDLRRRSTAMLLQLQGRHVCACMGCSELQDMIVNELLPLKDRIGVRDASRRTPNAPYVPKLEHTCGCESCDLTLEHVEARIEQLRESLGAAFVHAPFAGTDECARAAAMAKKHSCGCSACIETLNALVEQVHSLKEVQRRRWRNRPLLRTSTTHRVLQALHSARGHHWHSPKERLKLAGQAVMRSQRAIARLQAQVQYRGPTSVGIEYRSD